MKILIAFTITLATGFMLTACSPESALTSLEKIDHSHDFFHSVVGEKSLSEADQNWQHATDCRANISKVLCEVDPLPEDQWSELLDRRCLGNEQKYLPALLEIYDGFDSINQKMFCSLRRIFIEREYSATAYASSVGIKGENGKITQIPGAVIGIRKSLLERKLDLAQWLSWKEQLNFTAIKNEFTTPLAYPVYKTHGDIPLLQYVLVHEIGHLFDFANNINEVVVDDPTCEARTTSRRQYHQECKPHFTPTSWGLISWENIYFLRAEKDFFGSDKFCFYNCKSYPNKQDMLKTYKGLSNSDFLSGYAASSFMEDFAESWAAHWLIKTHKADLSLHASRELNFKVSEKYNSKKFAQKRSYLEQFLKSEIKYP
jgi:hypothetical protein